MNAFDLILRPVITEKATAFEKAGKYQFFVHKDATKIDIREAFEEIYGIEAVKVNVMRTPSKTKIGKIRRPVMKKHELKKVIVTTKGKKTLDITKPKIKS
jgi:large subunit ribosomal protein L23